MVCMGQADSIHPYLSRVKLDDVWTFERKHGGWHHWVEGRSSNPRDPVLIIDPWVNEVDDMKNISNPRLYRTVDPAWAGFKMVNGVLVRDINGQAIK